MQLTNYEELAHQLSKMDSSLNWNKVGFNYFLEHLNYYDIAAPRIECSCEDKEITAIWRDGDQYAEFSISENHTVTYLLKEKSGTTGEDEINIETAIFMLRQSFVYNLKRS